MAIRFIILAFMITTVYTHPSGLAHDTGFSHPERPDRLKAILELLEEEPFSDFPRVEAPAATEDQLLLAHPYFYIQRIEGAIPDHGHVAVDGDTILSPGSWEAALHAAGAVCRAVDDVVTGKTDRAFCAMRPPGHHAEAALSMGFCVFNNIFIGARYAQEAHGIQKIAIVDFDVHHGNGTDSLTRQHDGSIMLLSSHQHPLWPMTGLEEDNDDCVMNFILPPASGSERMRSLYVDKIFPELERFAPDLLMISAGFDAHRLDPLAQLNWEDDDYRWVSEELCEIADRLCGGRVVSVLEGGYNLEALKSSGGAHLKALAGL